MDLEGTLLRVVPGRVRQMPYNLTYMWNLKTKTKMNLWIQRTESWFPEAGVGWGWDSKTRNFQYKINKS